MAGEEVNVFNLIDQEMENQVEALPVVDVADSSDEESGHDPRATLCPCSDCTKKIKKGKAVANQSQTSENDAPLKCLVCFEVTSDGGAHHPCSLACGHVLGLRCSINCLSPGYPPICLYCKSKMIAHRRELRLIHATSARDDELQERADASKETEVRLRKVISNLVELNQLLFECLKRYADIVYKSGSLTAKP